MGPDEYAATSHEAREAYLASLTPEGLLQLGAELYNAGHHWHAHEAWEEVWLDAPNELRHFYQGLIQITAAFVHVGRNQYPGSVKLLAEGIAKLERYLPERLGVDTASFVDGSQRARESLLALGEKGIARFDRGLIPELTLRAASEPGGQSHDSA